MWIKILAFLIAMLSGQMLFGQTKLSGVVRDTNQKPIASATLTIRNKEGKIAAFQICKY